MYPYVGEIELLATAIRMSKRPDMVLSVMPGDGAMLSGGQAVAKEHWVTSYRVTPDFHADTGSSAGVCRNPSGCYGSAGGHITLAACDPHDKAQAWQWKQVNVSHGVFVMPFSDAPVWSPTYPTLKGQLALSCRFGGANSCFEGDDLDLWYQAASSPNQLLNGSSAPTLTANGVLSFATPVEPQTCVENAAGILRMANCSAASTMQWKLVDNGGSVQIQSVKDNTMHPLCIIGGGGAQPPGSKGNVNWPPVFQFVQAAKFAPLIGLNGTFVNLDDLPMGHMTLMGCNVATLGPCIWTEPQQRSVFTLYVMVRSPIMFSGDMPTDEATLKIVTNQEVLAIQTSSSNNRQVYNKAQCVHITDESYQCSEVVWAADDGAGGQYVAVFWTGLSANRNVTVSLSAVRSSGQGAKVRELWKGVDLPPVAAGGSLTVTLQGGDVALFQLS